MKTEKKYFNRVILILSCLLIIHSQCYAGIARFDYFNGEASIEYGVKGTGQIDAAIFKKPMKVLRLNGNINSGELKELLNPQITTLLEFYLAASSIDDESIGIIAGFLLEHPGITFIVNWNNIDDNSLKALLKVCMLNPELGRIIFGEGTSIFRLVNEINNLINISQIPVNIDLIINSNEDGLAMMRERYNAILVYLNRGSLQLTTNTANTTLTPISSQISIQAVTPLLLPTQIGHQADIVDFSFCGSSSSHCAIM